MAPCRHYSDRTSIIFIKRGPAAREPKHGSMAARFGIRYTFVIDRGRNQRQRASTSRESGRESAVEEFPYPMHAIDSSLHNDKSNNIGKNKVSS